MSFERFNIEERGWQVSGQAKCCRLRITLLLETCLYWGAVFACIGRSCTFGGIGPSLYVRELSASFLE
jgi:hypothetical protein